MKKTTIILITLFSLEATSCFAQREQDIMKSFKIKVNKIDSLFSKSPTALVNVDDFSYSPTGKLSYLLKFTKINVSYDIQKTSSLVSPYTAYIILTLKVLSNKEYGNVESPISKESKCGFDNADQALQTEKFGSCTESLENTSNIASLENNSIDWCVGDIRISYAYQEGKWIYKMVDTDIENRIKDGEIRGDTQKEIPKIITEKKL